MKNQQKHTIQILANGEGIFFEKSLKKVLYNKYKIVSKNIGVDKSTKNMKDFIIQPYLMDKISVGFLFQNQPTLFEENNIKFISQNLQQLKQSLQMKVFSHLKQKYFLINGHKFGSTFLAYDQNPQKNHAKALIFCGQKIQAESNFNHMTRLAEIAKKQCHFAYFDEESEKIVVTKLERQKKQKTKREKIKQKQAAKAQQKQNEKNEAQQKDGKND